MACPLHSAAGEANRWALAPNKWLVVDGFVDEVEASNMQLSMGSGSGARRIASKQGYKLMTRKYVHGDTVELWIKKYKPE